MTNNNERLKMFNDLDANEFMRKLMWRRLGYTRILSDKQFEDIMLDIIHAEFRKENNAESVTQLRKLKNYLAWFNYFSGPCIESRLYKMISNGLKKPQNAIAFNSATPLIYVYRAECGNIIPVARRAKYGLVEDAIQDAIVVDRSRIAPTL